MSPLPGEAAAAEREPELRHDAAKHRYVAAVDGEVVAATNYYLRGGATVFYHTEIDVGHDGHVLGSALARFALDDQRAAGATIVPLCPFIRGWIERHPDYDDLVDHDRLTAMLR